MKGASGKLSDIYLAAWRLGLKTTYYLRTLAASQIEKSTLDAGRFGFTQKREYEARRPGPRRWRAGDGRRRGACRIDDPDCEACQ